MDDVTIRTAVADDAPLFLDMWSVLDSETEFLLYEPGERAVTLEQQRNKLTAAATAKNIHILVASNTKSTELAGIAAGKRDALSRENHRFEIIIALRQKYTGQGLGYRMLLELESWAASQKIHRMELAVMANNPRAIKLYEKCGYRREGTKVDGVKLKSGFVDLHMMAKIIGKAHVS